MRYTELFYYWLFPVPKFPIPCSLLPAPCSLLPVPYSLFPVPINLIFTSQMKML
ncbi:MAG: hypothetical protein F6J98_49310 [Moorea sp. SIO4G2]|uniref:hypothetical protein n=1 Tax=unclassified Moorena TaxID=2683338 RepID=UPI0013FB3A01|nr:MULTISPECIES: hypothetical protein [unclassified Moorena]NEO14716.1 hypothetical protein [Moorena sp. SIO3E8]NEO67919.1 hypothetical protein [Moorena sp. SIO4G2]NEQ01150.1 hypothetical protein [Moorena sp. SIO3F7]